MEKKPLLTALGHTYVLGAQLSSRCLSIDGSRSKCWLILTYPKRPEPSLDIWQTNRFDTLLILFWRHILLVVLFFCCSYEDIEKWLDSWIASKDELFYRNGIRALPERWAKVVANDRQYFE